MLIIMTAEATSADLQRVCERITDLGFAARTIPGAECTAIGLVGNPGPLSPTTFEQLPGVREVIRVTAPHKLVSRDFIARDTVITLPNGAVIGGPDACVIAGPCSVESEEQLMTTASYVAAAGCRVLRGGAFKPRTSPYEFQGLGLEGLRLLQRARQHFGLAIVTEALDAEGASLVAEYADIIQIGARNMQNYALLRHVGRLRKPVMLKRSPSGTVKEWLLAAEYIASEGNQEIILCERGIRSFDDVTRNLMDVAAIPVVRALSHLPVIADPSHATGRRALVLPMARAAIAAGAHGVIVETHPWPEKALSDGPQALLPDQLHRLVREIASVHAALRMAS
jgi:3-deoxy-7-phosphoheptulonate synthase